VRENRKNAHLAGDMAHPACAPATGNSVISAPPQATQRTQPPPPLTKAGAPGSAPCSSALTWEAMPCASPVAPPNYFTGAEVAARYAMVRPSFHQEALLHLRSFAGIERFHSVLDVGCGTGQSSIALASIADRVIAIDPSQEMLNLAPPRPNVLYRLGLAEQLDFAAGEFDLVSASSALHWFDQDRFYAQCRRVLAPAGLLVVYNDHFTTHMQDAAACRRWMRSRFARQFPSPRRGMRDIDERKAADGGFTVAHRSSFTHLVRFSREEFIAFLLTRSNTLAAIQRGDQTPLSIADWLNRELLPILPDGASGQFLFKCNLWLLQRSQPIG
jgi:SAM-dependent methyltransferase